ncbi:MAG: methyltransferase domain-containing protein [Pyrinomonadaceae bacterium]|nr:methyltransferase domain-containing protein [Pyrinomonadaceae bacterium]
MQREDYESLHALEANLWWFAGMREVTAAIIYPLLPRSDDRRILDAGCGTGGNLEWLRAYAGKGKVIGIDLVTDALSFCNTHGSQSLAQASVTHLPFADSSFDLVTSFDVLVQLPGEHADEVAVQEMYRVLRPGGYAFVRVAAYEWMRSGHDEALGTQRRYSLPALQGKLEQAGFQIRRATYANFSLLPLAALNRLVFKRLGLTSKGSDVKPLPPGLQWLDGLLKAALTVEGRWLARPGARLPAGLSAICVAEKPI